MYSEIMNWKKAAFILENHDKPDVETSRKMISNRLTDAYINEANDKKLKWEEDQYKIQIDNFVSNIQRDNAQAPIIEETK